MVDYRDIGNPPWANGADGGFSRAVQIFSMRQERDHIINKELKSHALDM